MKLRTAITGLHFLAKLFGKLSVSSKGVYIIVKYLRWSVPQKVNDFHLLTIYANLSISYVWQGSEQDAAPWKVKNIPSFGRSFFYSKIVSGIWKSWFLNIALWSIWFYYLEMLTICTLKIWKYCPALRTSGC